MTSHKREDAERDRQLITSLREHLAAGDRMRDSAYAVDYAMALLRALDAAVKRADDAARELAAARDREQLHAETIGYAFDKANQNFARCEQAEAALSEARRERDAARTAAIDECIAAVKLSFDAACDDPDVHGASPYFGTALDALRTLRGAK